MNGLDMVPWGESWLTSLETHPFTEAPGMVAGTDHYLPLKWDNKSSCKGPGTRQMFK